jgi:hypothetical protein
MNMKLVTLSDTEYDLLVKALGDSQESLALLERTTRDATEFTRYSCDSWSEMSGMYEDQERGRWLFRHDVVGYRTTNLYKARYKYKEETILADTLEEATEKAVQFMKVQKSALHKMKIWLSEQDVKVDDNGNHVTDEKEYVKRQL